VVPYKTGIHGYRTKSSTFIMAAWPPHNAAIMATATGTLWIPDDPQVRVSTLGGEPGKQRVDFLHGGHR